MIHHYITILQFPPPPILNIDAHVHINIKRGVAYIVNMFTCTIEYTLILIQISKYHTQHLAEHVYMMQSTCK